MGKDDNADGTSRQGSKNSRKENMSGFGSHSPQSDVKGMEDLALSFFPWRNCRLSS
jgi:hypothetical protein